MVANAPLAQAKCTDGRRAPEQRAEGWLLAGDLGQGELRACRLMAATILEPPRVQAIADLLTRALAAEPAEERDAKV